ncbi:PEP-CTERM sorting domain-containing protein [Parahaliea mediterranea]|uniref:PEP-CTERM sorting domain-containing protein n=1 Tax=Parahaliea mediterranea TaxID=651086 RepID=UPI000E2ED4DC|nr:PEP-CTERM sorting domain-containing protein [Parahaliea mediterranea]
MKKLLQQLTLAVGVIFGASANAAVITDTITFGPDYIGYGETFSYSHDLSGQFLLGTATSGTLTISLTDDNSVPGGFAGLLEAAFEFIGTDLATVVVELFDFDTGAAGIPVSPGGSLFAPNLDTAALLALNADGILNIDVRGFLGADDLYINSSSLSIVADVPVPATLALMGLGLLGFGVASRRKQRA